MSATRTTSFETLRRATVAVAIILLFPSIAVAEDPPSSVQATTAETGTLDAATLAALGIDSPAAVASQAARRMKPDTGTWSWTPGAYAYDSSGNITAIGTTQTFVYDLQGRLVDAVVSRTGGTEHRAYTYDRFGNRTGSSAVGTSTPTSTSTNHLTSSIAVYDDAGNLTQLQPPTQAAIYQYKYDRLGALQEVKATNVTGTPTQLHIYTAGDERLWTYDLSANTSHWKIRDLGGKVLRDYAVSGTTWSLARDYVYRNGLLLAAVTPTGILEYSLDHLGTPRVITDAARTRVGFHHYLPFGEEITDETGAQEGEPMKFTGHERDADVSGGSDGLDYMHARYYSAGVGRFLSVDPVLGARERPQSWNRYAYALNNPLNFVDPTGMEETAYVCDENGDNCYYETTQREPTDEEYFDGLSDSRTWWLSICWLTDRGAFFMAEPMLNVLQGLKNDDAAQFASGAAVIGAMGIGLGLDSGMSVGLAGPSEASMRSIGTASLAERLTLDEAMGGAGTRIMADKINDPRYPAELFAKMQHVHTLPNGKNVTVHYWQNLITGARFGYKFK